MKRLIKYILKLPFQPIGYGGFINNFAMKLQQISFRAKNYIEFDLFKE